MTSVDNKQRQQQDPDPVYVLRSGTDNITSLKFSVIDGKDVLIVGAQNGIIRFWDIKTKRAYFELDAGCGEGVLYANVIEKDGVRMLISHDRNGHIKFWDASNVNELKLINVWNANKFGFCPIDVVEEETGLWISFPSKDSSVTVSFFDMERKIKKEETELKPTKKLGMVMRTRLFMSNDVMLGLIGYEDGSIALWEVSSRTMKSSLRLYTDPIMALDLDCACIKGIASSVTNKINMFSITENLELKRSGEATSIAEGFSALCIRLDNKLVAAGGWDGKVRVYSWKKLKLLALLKYHTKTISVVCFSQNHFIAAASNDGKISLWDVYKNS